ncbi:MAG TPA: phosphotransferase [Acidimicrobiales bacterium]|nr:phosphotransferase [Acidimicrobiales bacterium]
MPERTTTSPVVERPVASSVEELLAGATEREAWGTADSKSGAHFERVTIDGEPHVVKYLHVDDDWIMRSTGDLACRPVTVWRAGILDRLPSCIDHGVVGVATGFGRNGWGAAILMRDMSPWLVPEGDQPVPLDQHLRFVDHMATLHASFWGFHDTVGLTPDVHRFAEFSRDNMVVEQERGWPDVVPPLIVDGWTRYPSLAPAVADAVLALAADPTPLTDALRACPRTFLHGDWKMGNLGSRPDGTTVLLDWAMPGEGCPTVELAWYLAINAAKLPQSKEDTADAYRDALEAQGVVTGPWWDRALDLALLAGSVWFGWEKALGGPGPELAWWVERADAGLARL